MISKQLILMEMELSCETSDKFSHLASFNFFLSLSFVPCRAAEFILYKLKEMGKIDEEDIDGILQEFEQLDYDDSGTLTNSDLILAQTTS